MQSFFIIGFAIVVIILHHRYVSEKLIKSTMKQYTFDRAAAEAFLHRKHEIIFEFRKRFKKLPCDENRNELYQQLRVKMCEEIDDLVEMLREPPVT